MPSLLIDGGSIDLDSGQVMRDGAVRRLTARELNVVRYLARSRGSTVPTSELLVEVWGQPADSATRAVAIAIRRIRQKIEPEPSRPVHLLTVHGEGYRLVEADAEVVPSSPPIPTGPLFGRSAERHALAQLLERYRLVVVTGPSGVGKSRLVAEVAPQATWLDASACRRAATIRRALDPLDGEGWVVLDGLDGAPLPDELGRSLAARRLRVLVTARAATGVPEEAVLPLAPLRPEAVRDLLVHQARRRHPSFGEDEGAVDALASALPGLPPIIDEVARRATVLSAAELAERAAAGQLGVREALTPLWVSLGPTLQGAVRRCAVFAGAFGMSEAEQVLGPSALEDLAALVVRGWVRRDPDGFLVPRAMRPLAHPLPVDAVARHAALACAAEPPRPEELEHALRAALPSRPRDGARCLVRLARMQLPGRGPELLTWGRRLAGTPLPPTEAAALHRAMAQVASSEGQRPEALGWLDACEAFELDPEDHLAVLHDRAQLLTVWERHPEAAATLRRMRGLAEATGRHDEQVVAEARLGLLGLALGERAQARAHVEAARAASGGTSLRVQVLVLAVEAQVCAAEGDLLAARHAWEVAIAHLDAAGKVRLAANYRRNLANALADSGELAAALEQAEQVLATYRRLRIRRAEAEQQANVLWMRLDLGDIDRVLRDAPAALAEQRRLGMTYAELETQLAEGLARWLAGDERGARSCLSMAARLARDRSDARGNLARLWFRALVEQDPTPRGSDPEEADLARALRGEPVHRATSATRVAQRIVGTR